jgi:hypothetical protein
MVRALGVLLALAAVLTAAAPALAVPPAITAVGQQDRHPTVTFSAPRADSVSIYIASRPDRATDGSFLQENVVETGFLADNEIQSGWWLDSSQIDPGSYFVMVRASRDYDGCVSIDPNTFDSVTDPLCADGFSAVMPLTVPTPKTTYTVKTQLLRSIRVLYLTLRGDPLGVDVPYQLCWRQPTGKKKTLKKRCVKAMLDGYSWNGDATDMLRVNTKGMARRTKFTWSTRGEGSKVLLSKTIKVY